MTNSVVIELEKYKDEIYNNIKYIKFTNKYIESSEYFNSIIDNYSLDKILVLIEGTTISNTNIDKILSIINNHDKNIKKSRNIKTLHIEFITFTCVDIEYHPDEMDINDRYFYKLENIITYNQTEFYNKFYKIVIPKESVLTSIYDDYVCNLCNNYIINGKSIVISSKGNYLHKDCHDKFVNNYSNK